MYIIMLKEFNPTTAPQTQRTMEGRIDLKKSTHLIPEPIIRQRSYSSSQALSSQSGISSANLTSHVKLDLVQYMTLSGKTKKQYKSKNKDQDVNENSNDKEYNTSEENAIVFGNYIRAGLQQKMKGMLEQYGVGILKNWFTLQMYLKRNSNVDGGSENEGTLKRRNSSRDAIPGEESSNFAKDIAQIEVTPLHLAILSRQEASLETILDSILTLYSELPSLNRSDRLTEADQILATKVKVTYPGNTLGIYSDEDCMLDGMNIIHLATRYFPKGLETIIRVIRRKEGLFNRVKYLIEEQDNQIQSTPLHVAASCGSIMATRILLVCEAEVNSTNKYGYTPLHLAVQAGSEECTYLLLKNGANVNLTGNMPSHDLTPLHLAKNKKVVALLLRFGADPFVNTDSSTFDSQIKPTVFQGLLVSQPEAAEELLDDAVMTNGMPLESENLLVILDFKHFCNESLNSKVNTKIAPKPLDKALSLPYKNERAKSLSDEMALHKMVLKSGVRKMMTHPILESFLYLKWQLTKKLYLAHVFLYLIFILSFSSLVVLEVMSVRCTKGDVGLTLTEERPCECTRVCPDVSKFAEANNDLEPELDCFYMWNTTKGNSIKHCHTPKQHQTEIILFTVAWIGWGFLLIREVLQLGTRWKSYFKDHENKMEILLLVFSGFYLLMFLCPALVDVKYHLAAWSLFFGWIEVTFLLGRFPLVGVLIHMSFKVIREILMALIVFLPVIIAFALSFHTLLRSNKAFESPFSSHLKVMTLLAGEFEYYDNFSWDASLFDKAKVSVQLLFVLSFAFMTIIIMNLLIGLTVSKLEELSRHANIIRLEKMVNLISSAQDALQTGIRIFKCEKLLEIMHLSNLAKTGGFFHYINSITNEYRQDQSNTTTWFDTHCISSSKICFEPNREKMEDDEDTRKIFHVHSNLSIYLYDECTGKKKDLNNRLQICEHIVKKCMDLIRERQKHNRHSKAKTLDDDMGFKNLRSTMALRIKRT